MVDNNYRGKVKEQRINALLKQISREMDVNQKANNRYISRYQFPQ